MRDFNAILRQLLVGGIALVAVAAFFFANGTGAGVVIGYVIAVGGGAMLTTALTGYGVRAGILAAKQLERTYESRRIAATNED